MEDMTLLYRDFNKKMRRVSLLHRLLCQSRIRTLDIQPSEHMLLMRLSREEGTPSQKELAKKMELSTAAVAVSLKKLEGGGYIARCADQADNRINRITITEKGKKTVKDSHAIFAALDTEMFEGVGREDIDLCMTILEKLTENIKNALGDEKE